MKKEHGLASAAWATFQAFSGVKPLVSSKGLSNVRVNWVLSKLPHEGSQSAQRRCKWVGKSYAQSRQKNQTTLQTSPCPCLTCTLLRIQKDLDASWLCYNRARRAYLDTLVHPRASLPSRDFQLPSGDPCCTSYSHIYRIARSLLAANPVTLQPRSPLPPPPSEPLLLILLEVPGHVHPAAGHRVRGAQADGTAADQAPRGELAPQTARGASAQRQQRVEAGPGGRETRRPRRVAREVEVGGEQQRRGEEDERDGLDGARVQGCGQDREDRGWERGSYR